MIERIIISGFGGQGVMFLGRLISWAAMRENKFVTFLPAYGAEVRGGTSHCSIIISDREIASPCVEQTDTLIAMNQPSVDKFIGLAAKGSDVFINSSMAKSLADNISVKINSIPFSDIASKLGNIKSANMAALGAYIGRKNVLSKEGILKLLPEAFKNNPKLIQLNTQAIEEGLRNV